MDIEEITQAIAAARAEHHTRFEGNLNATLREVKESTDHIRELNELLVAVITEGCKPCPNCGNAPHGIFHEGSKTVRASLEIGCLHCVGRVFKGEDGKVLPLEETPSFHVRTTGTTSKSPREMAVERWNAEQWDAPHESLRAKHASHSAGEADVARSAS
jgi:hypothetical protein